jgi:hypothetical protein
MCVRLVPVRSLPGHLWCFAIAIGFLPIGLWPSSMGLPRLDAWDGASGCGPFLGFVDNGPASRTGQDAIQVPLARRTVVHVLFSRAGLARSPFAHAPRILY